MKKDLIITIDGPSASGKTSLSRELSRKLRVPWVSTGIFYRGIGYISKLQHVDLQDEVAVEALVKADIWKVKLTQDFTQFLLNGKDVTSELQAEEVGLLASRISRLPKVRSALLDAQRMCASNGSLIAEGRDCGTVVFPNADLKFFVTASAENRALRRANESGADLATVKVSQVERDKSDKERQTAPLVVPEGSIAVDSTGLTLEEVVRLAESHVLKFQSHRK
jgi:cytidylate kinase